VTAKAPPAVYLDVPARLCTRNFLKKTLRVLPEMVEGWLISPGRDADKKAKLIGRHGLRAVYKPDSGENHSPRKRAGGFFENSDGTVAVVPLLRNGDDIVQHSILIGSLLYDLEKPVIVLRGDRSGINSRAVLRSLGILKKILGPLGFVTLPYTLLSCPMCGRCTMNIPRMARRTGRIMDRLVKRYGREGKPLDRIGGIRVAVMGCNVNGPGEARDADIGIAGGKGGTGTVFMNGEPVATLPKTRLVRELEERVRSLIEERFGTVGR